MTSCVYQIAARIGLLANSTTLPNSTTHIHTQGRSVTANVRTHVQTHAHMSAHSLDSRTVNAHFYDGLMGESVSGNASCLIVSVCAPTFMVKTARSPQQLSLTFIGGVPRQVLEKGHEKLKCSKHRYKQPKGWAYAYLYSVLLQEKVFSTLKQLRPV